MSNLQGTEVVASMVVFEDGLPRKSDYRRFVIKGVDGQNDVAAMHETITRRFKRLLDERADSTQVDLGESEDSEEERGPVLVDPDTGRPRKFAYAPGLVVVDGGPPQVAAAQRALDELGIDDIPVVGLAKRLEEVWVPGQEDPVILARTSEGLYLLQRVRDEAHRFAITHHRNRRSKSMVESVLDDVPGSGRGASQGADAALRVAEEASRRLRRRHRCAARFRAAHGDRDQRRLGAESRRDGPGCQHDHRRDPRRRRMQCTVPTGRTRQAPDKET